MQSCDIWNETFLNLMLMDQFDIDASLGLVQLGSPVQWARSQTMDSVIGLLDCYWPEADKATMSRLYDTRPPAPEREIYPRGILILDRVLVQMVTDVSCWQSLGSGDDGDPWIR